MHVVALPWRSECRDGPPKRVETYSTRGRCESRCPPDVEGVNSPSCRGRRGPRPSIITGRCSESRLLYFGKARLEALGEFLAHFNPVVGGDGNVLSMAMMEELK